MCGSVSVGAALRWILIKSTTYSSVIWRWWRTRWRRQWLLLLLLSLKFWRLTVVGNECFQLVAAASLAAAVFLSTAEFVFGYCICFRCSLLEFSLLSMNIYFIHTYICYDMWCYSVSSYADFVGLVCCYYHSNHIGHVNAFA